MTSFVEYLDETGQQFALKALEAWSMAGITRVLVKGGTGILRVGEGTWLTTEEKVLAKALNDRALSEWNRGEKGPFKNALANVFATSLAAIDRGIKSAPADVDDVDAMEPTLDGTKAEGIPATVSSDSNFAASWLSTIPEDSPADLAYSLASDEHSAAGAAVDTAGAAEEGKDNEEEKSDAFINLSGLMNEIVKYLQLKDINSSSAERLSEWVESFHLGDVTMESPVYYLEALKDYLPASLFAETDEAVQFWQDELRDEESVRIAALEKEQDLCTEGPLPKSDAENVGLMAPEEQSEQMPLPKSDAENVGLMAPEEQSEQVLGPLDSNSMRFAAYADYVGKVHVLLNDLLDMQPEEKKQAFLFAVESWELVRPVKEEDHEGHTVG